ncbi:ATP-binding cassette domain-containing protein [Streptomyces sp. NPDC058534]|uniref:ATP-binding cassette domain-containing protein n=1 Tax=Streptomyces sp. NPDC058534 TaxID=3346541 RepID=UPI00364DCA27
MTGPLKSIGSTATLAMWLIGVAGAAVLALLVNLAVKQRRREYGVLLAMGERKGKLIVQQALEMVVVAAVAVGLSSLFAGALTQYAGQALLGREAAAAQREIDSWEAPPPAAQASTRASTPTTSRSRTPTPSTGSPYVSTGRTSPPWAASASASPSWPPPSPPARSCASARGPSSRKASDLTMTQSTTTQPVLRLDGVSHTYADQRRTTTVLKSIDCAFDRGTFHTVLGPSGSGKTTLLSLAGGLDAPTKGTVSFDGRGLMELGLGRYRNKHAATVFQQYNLLTYMTALQNITTAMEITGVKPATGSRRSQALRLLESVGLDADTARRNVLRLSGGQQQRVAIARALACDVDILFADEPTGNLDEDTAQGVIDIFRELAHAQGKCVVVVTHSQRLAAQSDRVLTLRKGRVFNCWSFRLNRPSNATYQMCG